MTHKPECRVCGGALFDAPLLCYTNMPKAAQGMPGPADLAEDAGVDMDVWQCAGCGLVQLVVPPVPYYKEVIRAAAVSADMAAFRRQQFAGWARQYGLVGRKVIEIGCGRGEYLRLLAESGVDAFGIEAAPASVAEACGAGLRVTQAYAGDAGFAGPDGPYDGFCILNFMEHMPDLPQVLANINRLLTPGGVGLIEVPNFDMMLRKGLFAEFVTDHLYYFTKDTLAHTLGGHGFDVVECGEILHDYVISATVRRREPLDVRALSANESVLGAALEAYLEKFGPNRVAIWGAGHQAFAVMALYSLGGRVRYVVDSAPFKQGRFTPATHIPIVPPERLAEDPVDAIIVMAGGYSDEVVRLVKNRWAPGVQVAILRHAGLEDA